MFSGINEQEIYSILKCLFPSEKAYVKGEYILRCGDTTTAMGLVLSESVRVFKEDYWDHRAILTEIHPGQFFGETYACSCTKELATNVIAARDTSVLFLDVNRI